MFVLNTTVQTKLLGAQSAQNIEAAVKQLTDNAEKNPNKAIATLKTLVLASPPPRSLLDPLMTLLKHDKDKADRLGHLILSQLSGAYNISDKFNAVSQILLKNVNGKNLSKKALALRSYGAILPRENASCSEAVRGTVLRLMPVVSEASSLLGEKKKLSSKDAATIWETIVVMEYCLLVTRYLIAQDPACDSEKEISATINDISELKLVDLFVLRMQAADLTVARHCTALLLEIAKRKPDVVFACLQSAFSAADSEFGGLFSLPLWRDVLAGSYLIQAFICIAAAEYSKCIEAATVAAKKERDVAASLTFNEDGDEDVDDEEEGDDDVEDAKSAGGQSASGEGSTCSEDKVDTPLVLKKPIPLTASAKLAMAWATRGMLAPKQSVKLFVETVSAFSHHWDMFCSVPLTPSEDKNAEKNTPTILAAAVDRILALLAKPSSVPSGAKQALLHLAETLGKSLVNSKPSMSLTEAEIAESWDILERLSPPLERISGSSSECAVIRGQALTALIWITKSAVDVSALSPLCAAVFSHSTSVFSEVWRSYEARVRTDNSFAASILDTSMEIILSRVSLASVFPIRPFESAWTTTLECNPTETHSHIVKLLRAPYMAGNRANLQSMKRAACVFIGDHCRALLSMPPPGTSVTPAPAKTPTSEPENPALLSLLHALEAHTLTGTPLTTRKDALEAVVKTALTVPEARLHVYEFLTSLDRASIVNGLDDACGTLAALVDALISYHELTMRSSEAGKSHDAELEKLKTQLQSYFNSPVFVL